MYTDTGENRGNTPSNVRHKAATDNEDGLLAVDAKVVHGVDNAQQRVHVLGLLANHGLVDRQGDAVVVKVALHDGAVELVHVEVHDGQAALPSLVAAGQLRVGRVEDAVEELKVVLDLFVAADGEALGRGLDGGFHVGHGGQVVLGFLTW